MKKILLALFLIGITQAQADTVNVLPPPPPLRVYNEGTRLDLSYKLNFTGAGINCTGPTAGIITCDASGGGGGGTTQTIDVINATAATAKTVTSAAANSGTNTGIAFNNSTTLSGTTRLACFKNNGTEKMCIDDDGAIVAPSIGTSESTLHALPTGTGDICSLDATQTLTNKTITAPVLSGTATGTYTLAGTPTITAPNISAPVLSGTATGTYTLAGTPTITAPTISGPTLSGSVIGTYTVAGTPTIGASLAVGTTATYAVGDTTHLLTKLATAKVIGGSSNTNGHTVPNAADDTFTLNAAVQLLTNKTLTGAQLDGPTLTADMVVNSDAARSIGTKFIRLLAIATTLIIGGSSNTNGHTVPNVADDTFTLNAATQTLSAKTLTSPVVNGATGTGGTFSADITARHLISNSAAPSCAPGTASKGAGSCTATGTAEAFYVTFTSGTTVNTADADLFTLTPATAWGTAAYLQCVPGGSGATNAAAVAAATSQNNFSIDTKNYNLCTTTSCAYRNYKGTAGIVDSTAYSYVCFMKGN